jgi:hypothetical protein
MVTHIFREGNTCADKLASIGPSVRDFTWWNEVHKYIITNFARSKVGLPVIDLLTNRILVLLAPLFPSFVLFYLIYF